jgi:hypothetical protein
MQFARIKTYRKDLNTGDLILIGNITDADGKPIFVESDINDIEIHFSQEGIQKLLRDQLPTEEHRIQEILDKIHHLRVKRGLFVEEIDEETEKVVKDAETDFKNCHDKIELAQMNGIYRVKLKALGEKRLLAKYAMHEESELSLQLTKLRQSVS